MRSTDGQGTGPPPLRKLRHTVLRIRHRHRTHHGRGVWRRHRSRVTWDACIPEAFVRKAFPTPFARLAKLRLPVTFSTMSEYWHRHTGPSPVFPCVVESRMRPERKRMASSLPPLKSSAVFSGRKCPRHTLQVENGARMWAHVSYAFTGAVRRVIIPERIV